MTTAYVSGAVGLLVFYGMSFVLTGSGNPLALAQGHNRNLSTSQLQFLLFTALTFFSYCAVAGARFLGADATTDSLPGIPSNLLLLMGMSVATTASSKGIAVAYLGQSALPGKDDSTLTNDRQGSTDLVKVQMFLWTVFTLAFYLFSLHRFLAAKAYAGPAQIALPDVDGALMVLMGVSQGAYIAGKIVSRSSGPHVEAVMAAQSKPGEVTAEVLGGLFGDAQEGSMILLDRDGQTVVVPKEAVKLWTDNRLTFQVPAAMATGSPSMLSIRVGTVKSRPVRVEMPKGLVLDKAA